MSRPLNVLLVEDVEDDALLVRRALRAGGFEPEIQRVETREAMTQALTKKNWDVVISDFSMPKFSGPEALEVLRETALDVPFIVVSGTIGEDIAVSMMKNGVQDYMVKGQLARLTPAVERELKEAELRRQKRQAESELHERELLFRSAFDSSALGMSLVGKNGRFLQVNQKLCQITGYNEAELLERSFIDITHPDDQEASWKAFNDGLAARSSGLHIEKRYLHKSGRVVWIALAAAVVPDDQTYPLYFIIQVQDITERKEAERKISEQAALLEHARDAILVMDMNQQIVYWNKGAERLYGWSAEEALGKRAGELFASDNSPSHETSQRRMLETGEWTGELQQRTKNGREIIVESRRTLMRDEKDQGKSILIINTDISERKRVALALAESEERFRQLAEQSSDGFWFVQREPERILYVSPAIERLWGVAAEKIYENASVWWSAIHVEDQARAREAFAACLKGNAARFESEFRVVRPDGSIGWVHSSGTPIRDAAGDILRIGGLCRDITERKETEGQMLRAQRMESIGTLAGGVAHDLNNALAPILMVCELMQTRYPDSTDMIDTIEASAQRGADMVKQLLTFAKGIDGKRLLIQPEQLLEEIAKFVSTTFPKNIVLKTDFAEKLQPVTGDATQLHQVLLNLCVNARDSMPDGGTLTIRAETVEVDTLYAQAVPEAKPGSYTVWRIQDTGTGIPPDVLDRIFEPFFSTKGPDKGTGLGLSTTIGIVQSHGGFVRVYSIVGTGTTFAVYLPVSRDADETSETPTKNNYRDFHGNNQTILVVDDDVGVRECLRAVLTALQFKVVCASDGTAALLLITECWTELCGVITDLHMPGMDGLAFVRLLREKLPQANVLVTSGRLDDDAIREFHSLGVKAMLDKPFTHAKLVEKLKATFMV
ncbi:MAG: PAS domain S-box protein [Chthoniobacterales bacterium]